MAEDSDLEKTEQATPKRLEQAREEGDVPRSRELATVAVLFSAGLAMVAMGSHLNQALKSSLATGLQFNRAMAFDPAYLFTAIQMNIAELLIRFAPLALVLMIVAAGSPALIGGWVFSSKALIPNFGKLNPVKGLGNLVSKNAAIELIKSIVKTLIVGFVAYVVIAQEINPILTLASQPVEHSIEHVGSLMLTAFLAIVGALVVIALIDVPYQLYQYANKLKMTKEEVRKEMKELEGNPEIKARIRQQQREVARRRMMAEIPKADVIITNPTHFAVAVKYQENSMRAPVVVAKGADAIALKIREIANEHRVLIFESPKLARALYAHTELGDEIPETLYSAVAEVLAYVFQLRLFKREGGFKPNLPESIAVPDALDPHHPSNNTAGLTAEGAA